jgi:hypothetical protein
MHFVARQPVAGAEFPDRSDDLALQVLAPFEVSPVVVEMSLSRW